jgi:hypothetical protein
MGISFHRGPAGESERGLVYWGLRMMDEMGVSLHRGPVGEPGKRGPSTGIFEN